MNGYMGGGIDIEVGGLLGELKGESQMLGGCDMGGKL